MHVGLQTVFITLPVGLSVERILHSAELPEITGVTLSSRRRPCWCYRPIRNEMRLLQPLRRVESLMRLLRSKEEDVGTGASCYF